MTNFKSATTSLCLICALFAAPLAPAVRASDDARARERLRPVFIRTVAPIGTVESFGRLLINGRIAQGREPIWGGELLQATAGLSARAQLDGVGQVTLARGAAARLATAITRDEPGSLHRHLIVAVVQGELKTELQPGISAYIEAGTQAFSSSEGAHFSLGLRDEAAFFEATRGTLIEESPPTQAIIVSAEFDPTLRKPVCRKPSASAPTNQQASSRRPASSSPPPGKAQYELRTKTTAQIGVCIPPPPARRALNNNFSFIPASFRQEPTPQGTTSLAGIQVTFKLRPDELGCLGTTTGCPKEVTVPADDQGLAVVQLIAGPKESRGQLIATTSYAYGEFDVRVIPRFPPLLKAVTIAAVAGLAIGAVIVVTKAKGKITPVPPPDIIR